MAADSVKKVKILVLGDTGVGKSSLVHLICHKEVLSHPTWTIGCTVEVKLHDFNQSLNSPRHASSYMLEFWDVGGAPYHKKGRPVFYQNVNGLILVHDLTNRKSHGHLTKWLCEFYNGSKGTALVGKGGSSRSGISKSESFSSLDYDPEQFVDQEVPMLIVGTKLDQSMNTGRAGASSGMTGAAAINVDCTDVRQFSIDSTQMIELNKFFDKVIERRYMSSLRPYTAAAAPSTGSTRGEASERLRSSALRRSLSNNSS